MNHLLSPGDIVPEIARWVRQSYPQGKGLILTGSAAREEATFVDTGHDVLWLSDLEFLVVTGNSADFSRECFVLDPIAREMTDRLKDRGVEVSVELTPAHERYFASIRPHLFGYELRVHGKQLYGGRNYLGGIPSFDWRDIGREDAWLLLSNRMIEWLDFRLHGAKQPLETQFYILTKEYLDLVTSLSFFTGHYQATYRGRAAACREMMKSLQPRGLGWEPSRFVEAVETAATFKVNAQGIYDRLFRGNPSRDLRETLEQAGWAWMHDQLGDLLLSAWRWELAELGGRAVVDEASALSAMRKIYSWKHQAAGWTRLVERKHFRAGGEFFRRMPRLCRLGPPRALVYACGSALLAGSEAVPHETMQWVRSHLPIVYGSCGPGWEDLAEQCVRNWKTYLRREYL